jgi:predicted transcriptional regulator of viral defense system
MNTYITEKFNNNAKQRVSANNRFAKIAATGEYIFHIDDLANIWNISNKHTLRMTLLRYAKSGNMYRIYRGLYSLKKTDDIDPYLLGIKALHSPAYISCESVLFDNGIINQPPQEITLISKFSKHFTVGNNRYRSRRLSPDFLFNDKGIGMRNGIRIASIERAIADIYYFNPKKYLDVINSKIVNWKKVGEIIEAVGYNVKV